MNAPVTFNTLAFVKRMEASGMDARQAEALAEALNEVVFDTIATKSDVQALRSDLKEVDVRISGELKGVSVDLRALELRLAELEARLMARMGVMIAGSTALTVAILGALITLN